MGLYYLAALLIENRHQVEILNLYHLRNDPSAIEAILREKKADVIGFSLFNANRWGAIDVAKTAKQIDPNVKIVFGGVAATHLWKHFLIHFPQVDFIILGEGEYSFLELIESIQRNNPINLETIKGIAFRKGGSVVKTDPAELIGDLDQLPMPAKYFSYQYVTLTRGCPANCSFCGSPQFWKRKVRWHSADYFVTQLEILYRRGVTFFYFSDDTFTLKKDLTIEICREILARSLNISWYAISRVDHIDEEILYWMRKAGCIQISYGVESGSEDVRKLLNKKISTEQIKNAFSLTTRYSILARAYFIYGCPGESAETIRQTVNLIKAIKPLSIIFYVLRLFPGTALYRDFQQKMNLSDDVWLDRIEDVPYFRYDPELTEERVLHYGELLRTKYYRALPSFVDALDLIEEKEFYPLHADFCSRLAMTFSHGDYSQIEAIPDKDEVAGKLYERSLKYSPNQRAFLGLGILKQKSRQYDESIAILSTAVGYFPESEMLHLCLGVSYMNKSRYDEAINIFLRFPGSTQAIENIANCYKALGDYRNEELYRKKLQIMNP
ncbi:MAG: radical SAM protein [Desulforhabdus sp.]|nr:radical SAM protein [Desulforhabdus sp.]